ncbi:heme anaerobic degradation radical SAM methyltransferase ChuW/HutW [Veillonella sp.]|uniref:heme anaerobic degradation radical SAM methyltransferase ChuW/HutW n=1 Tax=Veillonella sp. TaxID=1926307 RepID=UPI0025F9335F|nr:heme anaerobic degradation radical SAM methyltransferase ChuW/HutW [Veillonella sp.]
MKLEELFASMSEEERIIQFGRHTNNPLVEAFDAKRVVHAGLNGRPLSPESAQSTWESVMAEEPVKGQLQSAYIHIPFCQTKCLYCGFFQNAANQSAEDRYVDLLIEEMERDADHPRLKNGLIQTVFIGGGTPTSLSAHNVSRLLKTIKKCLPLANDYELTLEGRINDVVPEKMEAWFANGVNRMSLGVQSFHTDIRRQMGRLDDQETILKRLQAIKEYNQCSLVVDLIYGLPDQTPEKWLEDLQMLETAPIDGMDLYQLNVFENSDLNSQIQKGIISPAATTQEQAQMFALAREFVDTHNFRRLSAAHWSRSTRERSLYNMMAKRGYPMFPFGCGAGGNVNGYMTMLHRSLRPYEAMVEAGQKPFMVLMKQSPLQEMVNIIVDQLEHCHFDLRPLIAYDERLGDLAWLFDLWCDRGLCRHNGVMYQLTLAGEFWHVNLTQTTIEMAQYILTGETVMLKEKIAAQNKGNGGGHPAGVPKHGGSHPAGVPKHGGGHPAGVPKHGAAHPGGVPKGHPAGISKEGAAGHPHGIPKHDIGAHPTGPIKGHPAGIPKQ